MKALSRIWRIFFPPSRWNRCHEPMPWERLADWDIRVGQHKAAERMRAARIGQVIDDYTSSTVRPKIQPKLPNDNVVQIRRRRVA